MPSDVLVAVYYSADQAAEVVRQLGGIGVPSSAIHQIDQRHPAWGAGAAPGPRREGFWDWLFGTDESVAGDHPVYEDAVRRGGGVVTVTADASLHERVLGILESGNPIDLEDRSHFSVAAETTSADIRTEGTVRGRADATSADQTAALAGRSGTEDEAERAVERVIPLAEETLQVGKRVMETGRTRIRRYVVETPVEERIRLRTERVVIERRRPISGDRLSSDAFTERTTDIVERAEVPIVAKEARVAEEVVVRTEADEREETIRDTVRREEVDVSGSETTGNTREA